MTSAEIIEAIRQKFPLASHAVFTEVNEGTGTNVGRKADAVIISLWPSHGLDWIGAEVKVSRADLKAELENPSKAEHIARHLDFWYLVTPVGLTKGFIIPPKWGLWEVATNGRIHQVKAAERLEIEPSPAARRSFFASVARHAQKHYTAAEVKAAAEEAFKRGQASAPRTGGTDLSLHERELLAALRQGLVVTREQFSLLTSLVRAVSSKERNALTEVVGVLEDKIHEMDRRRGFLASLLDQAKVAE